MRSFIIFLVCCSFYQAQNTFSFEEKVRLKKVDNKFFTQSDKKPLKYVSKNDKKVVPTKSFVTANHNQSNNFYEVDTIVNYNNAKVFTVDTLQINASRLSGDMYIEDDMLLFYPVLNAKEEVKYNEFIKNHIFFFDLPDRSYLDVNYSSWHVGLLTLPVKAYFSSRSDSIRNNVTLGANINVMFGKKWGKKRYYNSLGSRENKVSSKSWSVNAILGVTQEELDIYNTTPQIGSTSVDVTNLSYGIAVGYQIDKFGFFIATGIDSPLSNLGKSWNFSNQPWVGLGIGIGFW